MTVSERLKEGFENAKTQIEGIEKQVEKKVAKLEKKAKAQLSGVKDQIDEVPAQLRGAWDNVVTRLRNALAFATRDELDQLTSKVDEIAKKLEKLIRGEKLRQSNASRQTAPKKV